LTTTKTTTTTQTPTAIFKHVPSSLSDLFHAMYDEKQRHTHSHI